MDLILAGEIDMVVNTPDGQGARADGYDIRIAATASDVAIITTTQQLGAAVQAIEARITDGVFAVRSLQEHDEQRAQRRTAAAGEAP